jgi:hypothetical protein
MALDVRRFRLNQTACIGFKPNPSLHRQFVIALILQFSLKSVGILLSSQTFECQEVPYTIAHHKAVVGMWNYHFTHKSKLTDHCKYIIGSIAHADSISMLS